MKFWLVRLATNPWLKGALVSAETQEQALELATNSRFKAVEAVEMMKCPTAGVLMEDYNPGFFDKIIKWK